MPYNPKLGSYRDLLEQVVERLIRVRDEKGALLGEVVVEIVDDLHGHVGFAGTRGTDHHGEAGLHAGADGLDLQEWYGTAVKHAHEHTKM